MLYFYYAIYIVLNYKSAIKVPYFWQTHMLLQLLLKIYRQDSFEAAKFCTTSCEKTLSSVPWFPSS